MVTWRGIRLPPPLLPCVTRRRNPMVILSLLLLPPPATTSSGSGVHDDADQLRHRRVDLEPVRMTVAQIENDSDWTVDEDCKAHHQEGVLEGGVEEGSDVGEQLSNWVEDLFGDTDTAGQHMEIDYKFVEDEGSQTEKEDDDEDDDDDDDDDDDEEEEERAPAEPAVEPESELEPEPEPEPEPVVCEHCFQPNGEPTHVPGVMVCASCFDHNENVVNELTNRISGLPAATDVDILVTIKVDVSTHIEKKSLEDALKNLVSSRNQNQSIATFCEAAFSWQPQPQVRGRDAVHLALHRLRQRSRLGL